MQFFWRVALFAVERISISPSLTHQFATRRLCQICYIASAGDAVRMWKINRY
jgi:hypothetical protein